MLAKFVPNKTQIADGLDHVYYEIEQLNNLLRIHYVSLDQHVTEQVLRKILDNVVLEMLLIHTRLLLDFFEIRTENRHKDDILCEDYRFVASPIEFSKSDRERINKEIAHLTYSRPRLDATDRGWKPASLALPILDRCKEFCSHILGDLPDSQNSVKKEHWLAMQRELEQTLKVFAGEL